MSKDPAFLFYSQDFIVGVQTMNFEDRGKYITILAQMHQQGRMNEETICFLVGSCSVSLKSKFSIDENGFWYSPRLESEIEKRKNYQESRKINGSKGGRPKNEKPYGKPYAKPYANHTEDENENEIVDRNTTKLIRKITEKGNSQESKFQKETFELFRKKYPGTKQGLDIEFKRFSAHKQDVNLLMPALLKEIAHKEESQRKGLFTPQWKNLSTWINQRCWEQELPVLCEQKSKNIGDRIFEDIVQGYTELGGIL